MTSNLKCKFYLLILVLGLFTSGIASANSDTLKPTLKNPVLKNKILNIETLINRGALAKSKKLNKQQIPVLSILQMNKDDHPDIVYQLVDTLHKSGSGIILLIGQEYESENKAWIASYGPDKKLISFKQVYYDNAEGFLNVESIIKNNVITITTINDFEGEGAKTKIEKFRIDSVYKIQKLPVK